MKLNIGVALRPKILDLIRSMSEVQKTHIQVHRFGLVQYGRLNRHYKAVLDLCERIVRQSSLHEDSGNMRFSGFMIDMNQVFEDFVAMQIELRLKHVQKQAQRKHWAEALQSSDHLPMLKPDLVINSHIIIDTKYYRSPTNNNKLHSNHLYQLLSYMQFFHQDIRHGILIYPQENSPVQLDYTINDLHFQVRTLNLGGTLAELKAELGNLCDWIKETPPTTSVLQPK